MLTIKHCADAGKVMYEVDASTIKEAVEQLAKAEKSLAGAHLRGADLRGANLSDAKP